MARRLGSAIIGFTLALATGAPAAAAPPILHEGTVRLPVVRDATVGFDLDAGVRDDRLSRSDMNWMYVCGEGHGGCGWQMVSGVWSDTSKRFSDPPTSKACREARYDASAEYSPDVGTWRCIRTDEGRYARVSIFHWPVRGARYHEIRCRTWDAPLALGRSTPGVTRRTVGAAILS